MASKPFGVDIDLLGNQLQNARWHNLPSDPAPASSKAGQEYFNTTTNTIRWYNGTVWNDRANPAAQIKHRQFFPAGDGLSLTITVDVATLPTDNNLISVYANGFRLFPDQGATLLDWSRNAGVTPTTITLRQRDGESIMVEW